MPGSSPGRPTRLDTEGTAVGLTAEVELALGDAGLVKFFDENRQAFKELASRSYGFAHDNVVA